jgi:hypothetical protein
MKRTNPAAMANANTLRIEIDTNPTARFRPLGGSNYDTWNLQVGSAVASAIPGGGQGAPLLRRRRRGQFPHCAPRLIKHSTPQMQFALPAFTSRRTSGVISLRR